MFILNLSCYTRVIGLFLLVCRVVFMGKYCKLFQTLYNFFPHFSNIQTSYQHPQIQQTAVFGKRREKKAVEQQELVKNKTKLIKEQKTRLQMGSALNINTTMLW